METRKITNIAGTIRESVLTTAQAHSYLRIMRRLASADGVLRYGELAKNRTDERLLSALVDAGEIVKVSFGCYALPHAHPSAQMAQRFKAKLTCISAAEFYGLRMLSPPQSVHLAIGRNRGLTLPRELTESVVIHREAKPWQTMDSNRTQYRKSEEGFTPSKLIAPWPAVFARLAICQPLHAAVVSLDDGLAHNLFSKDELLNLIPRRRYPDAVRSVRLASGKSQSVLESIARIELVMASFKVSPQHYVDGVGYLDLVVEGFIAIELDGFVYHSDRKQFRNDRARDRLLVQKGYRVLRYTFEDVMNNPKAIVKDVQNLLARLR